MSEIEYAQASLGEYANILFFFFLSVWKVKKQQLKSLRNEIRILQIIVYVCVSMT